MDPRITSEESPDSDPSTPLFREITESSGLDFVHRTAEPPSFYFPEINGSGAALFDCDLDGDLDIYLINLGDSYAERRSDPPSVNRMFRQTDRGRFEDVTQESGLGDPGIGTGVAVGDVNNDGYPDVYVANYGQDRLYLNRGDGTFIDRTEQAGIDNPQWAGAACFFDFDRDGWLDLYVINYVDYYRKQCTRRGGGDEDFCGPHQFSPVADRLFHNETGRFPSESNTDQPTTTTRFADVSLTSGIGLFRGPGLGAVSADFNGDQWPDLYVANDQTPNFLWINRQDGTFKNEAVVEGCAYDLHGKTQASMGIGLGDLDNDGALDLFVTNLDGERNTLYRGDPSRGFQDETLRTGMADSSLRFTGFGTALLDIEHDGDLDIALVNGAVRRPAALRGDEPPDDSVSEFWQPYAEPNQIFLQEPDTRFTRHTSRLDRFVSTVEVSRGLAVGDIDNDGDLDLLVTNVAGPARLYANESTKQGHWLQVAALRDDLGGRHDYGAIVRVIAGQQRWSRPITPTYSYACSNDPRAHFGLGSIDHVEKIEILWSDGMLQTFPGGSADRQLVLRRAKTIDDHPTIDETIR